MAQKLRAFPSLTVILWLAITLCGGTLCMGEEPHASGRSASQSSASSSGVRRKIIGVGNFGEVTPNLFRGAQPSNKGFKSLADIGIDIVVDTRGNRTKSEGKLVRRLGMRYVAIQIGRASCRERV